MPCWDTPFRMAPGKKGRALPHCPYSLASQFSAPCQVPPGHRNIKEPQRGGVGQGGQGSSKRHPQEGLWAGQTPDLFLCISFWDVVPSQALCGPLPLTHPLPLPPPPSPSPFMGQVSQSPWKYSVLQALCFPHLPPNPQLTHSREDESSYFNHQAWLRD